MLYRKFTAELEDFLLHEPNKILLVNGARQIGKSYLIRYVGKKLFRHYVEINLKADQESNHIFADVRSKEDFYLQLGAIAGNDLGGKDDTLVFLDEIQSYPHLMTMLKFLNEDKKYRYIASGSQLGVALSQTPSVPIGSIAIKQMYPLDFEEFLWAMGEDMLMDFVRKQFASLQPMGALHRKVLDYFRQYMIVGGMPQAVLAYSEKKDFEEVDVIKRDILQLYRNDISKYAFEATTKVTRIFDDIPSQLQKHEKKFRMSSISVSARMRDYEDSFFWLDDARIINICYNATEPSVGLKLNMDRTTLKCYLGDTGLLISQAFDENGLMEEQLYRKLMLGKLEVNQGMLVENVVAQMLKASGHKLFFFSKSDREDAANNMEVDFLIRKKTITSRHNICPVEVKSSSRYTYTSLNKFRAKYAEQLATPYVMHTGDVEIQDGVVFLPLYMTPLL